MNYGFIKSYKLRYNIILVLIFFVSTSIIIWLNEILPLQDYPDWLYQGFIFSEIIGKESFHSFEIIKYPIPNSISTIIIGILIKVFSPAISGKIFINVTILFFVFGLYYFSYNIKRINTVALLAILILSFNNSLYKGNVNYLMGMSFLFIGMGILYNQNINYKIKNILLSILTIIIFISHGLTFIIWIISFIIIYFYIYRKNISKIIFILAPSFFLFLAYILNQQNSKGIENNYNIGFFRNIVFKVHSFYDYLAVINDFTPNHSEVSFLILLLSAIINMLFFLLIIYLISRIFIKFNEKLKVPNIILAVIFIIIFLLTPYIAFEIYNPGQRFVYYFVFIIIFYSSHELKNSSEKTYKYLKIIFSLIFFIQIVYLNIHTYYLSNELKTNVNQLDSALVKNNLQKNFISIYEPDFERISGPIQTSTLNKLTPKIRPFGRLHYYLNIKYRSYSIIFPTGILKDNNRINNIKSVDTITKLKQKPDAILICMDDLKENNMIANCISDSYKIVFRNSYYFILKRYQ